MTVRAWVAYWRGIIIRQQTMGAVESVVTMIKDCIEADRVKQRQKGIAAKEIEDNTDCRDKLRLVGFEP